MAKLTVTQALQAKDEFELMSKDLKEIVNKYEDKLDVIDKVLLDHYANKAKKFAKTVFDTIRNQQVEI